MANPWDGLPNAKHIDRILRLASQKDLWGFDPTIAHEDFRVKARNIARVKARVKSITEDESLSATWIRDTAYRISRMADRGVPRENIYNSIRDALYALVAWKKCAYLLDLPPDAVRLIAVSGNHAAALLLPIIIALNKEPA